MQTRAKLLQNLEKARQVKKQLAMRRSSQQRVPQQRVQPQPQSRFVRVPRTTPIINPQLLSQRINPDLDVSKVKGDVMAKENISSGESIFHSLDDVVPRVLQRRRK